MSYPAPNQDRHRPTLSRREAESVSPDEAAPFMQWGEMFSYLKRTFSQGDHVAILGPTGTGKTHMALAIAEIRTYVIVLACKPKDPLVDDAVKSGYWLVPGNKLEIPYSDGRPLHKKVVYWPRMPETPRHQPAVPNHHLLSAERAVQKPLAAGALGYVRKNGHWAIVIDEGTYVCRDLGLQRDIDSALTQFRTLNASVVVLGQRPAWMGRYVLSQPTHLFIFQTSNSDDLKSLGDISGTDTRVVQHLVRNLDAEAHHALYINTRERSMFRTVAPPR